MMTFHSRFRLPLCAVLLLGTACASTPDRAAPDATQQQAVGPSEYTVAEDIHVRRLAPGVWLHTTLGGADYNHYPANGLLVEDGEGTLLVDTGWNARHAEQLMTWAQDTLRRPVRAAVVTHFHEDRTGGVPALVAKEIPVYGLEHTAKLATERGLPVPRHTVAPAQTLGAVEVFFPGAGHAPDNVVVFHPDSGVLFGGCFVKDVEAKDLGNVRDADVAGWPASLERTRERFPGIRVVVPGHGAPGGLELLSHTGTLLR
ncbi:subclass B1 metallo-beta-lactamase [Pyxidicoccus fallax]|uniref:beta-lactamase n=1 Tax=Pyxidicoccus fallax TaxID=394095 RepID=A0A848LCS7_9BACT|nr:subclass B1 metallo-beta-lactamase [Pyxidicoccus fallax]NMO14553.1 subclass B1 metallo-beta-lactamase [Pyxidicoccus fallax]NPC77072.1 subclass B1 metallo-beta-lactamase [Pyxidicoccus fallax]